MIPGPAREQPDSLDAASGRRAIAGFFLSGVLLSFVGAILPAWRYHLTSDFIAAGNYFFILSAGILAGVHFGQRVLAHRSTSSILSFGSAFAMAGFLFLAAVPPSFRPAWRIPGLFALGLASGLLHSGLFRTISPMYRRSGISTVNLAGALFGLGCMVTSLLVASTFYVYTVSSILILLSTIPGYFFILYMNSRFPSDSLVTDRPLRDVLHDLQTPTAILFTLLLFFQFGNEWSVAAWLPLFLIQRLGISPETSLLLLSLYWLTLLVGRLTAHFVIPRMKRGWLLIGSAACAVFGCLILSFANNRFGAITAIVLLGLGFAVVYPLLVEKIGLRFPNYHPGLFNGISAVASIGGLLAPGTLGYFAEFWGIRVVMLLPLLGTFAVFVLALMIWLTAKLSGGAEIRIEEPAGKPTGLG